MKVNGGVVELKTTSSGKNVSLTRSNLRIVVKGSTTEIHFCTNKSPGNLCGEQTVGVDKGYTEVLTDSDGVQYGTGFGKTLSEYSNTVKKTGIARNKIHAIEKKHRVSGRISKANRIQNNNLGRKKLEARRKRVRSKLKNYVYKAAHAVVAKASVVVAEDLSSPIAKKQPWKDYNRKMSSWAKGLIAEALEGVTQHRGAKLVLVNAAWTSQIDSQTGFLKGIRKGDLFYCESGDVIQADHNAAINVKERAKDREIGRYTPYLEVKRILLSRSGETDRQLA